MLFNQSSVFDHVDETSIIDLKTGEITPKQVKERVEHTMKIKMLENAPGSVDGITIQHFEAGTEYDLPKWMADAFIIKGYAENLEAAPTEQKVTAPEETKAAKAGK
ncbi:hypothetical protein GH810_14440 [Acetobacterium paludosum]|uniref:Uncharacterized protein n=1 Tax=Acetobacterium paludosum TaxID=52693 RepID=A0A923HZK2_9FIRM|nr:hypothetical protein [Acetobacterium paludosum]MBC3889509.1 hypothetical protein [Acetobacterium paludosum]